MSEIDRISELPECLITQILSYLPIQESVETSVLATSWKNHWLRVPVLDLNYCDFPYGEEEMFISFLHKFLEFNPELRLRRVKLESSIVEMDGFKDRIETVINRGIQHLDVKSSIYYLEGKRPYPFIDFMPLNLYTSKTLVNLKLTRSGLSDPGDSVSLPCLKCMYLRKVRWVAPMTLEKLLSGCPVLEELALLRDLNHEFEDHHDEPVVIRVKSRSLKRFCVPFKRLYSCSTKEYLLEIDAPELEYLSLNQDRYDRIVVKNLASLFAIKLDIKFAIEFGVVFDPEDLSKRNEIREFLTGITNVRHMIISEQTVKVLDHYSKVGPIPLFKNLSHLKAVFPRSSYQFFPVLLKSCPNLKLLIWKIVYTEETEEAFQVINVPRCFVSTLECVEIQGFFDWKEEELKIASYFLENSAVLKKLTLKFAHVTVPRKGRVSDSRIYEELSKVTKRSRECRILIGYEAL